jgi:hypothetical protein
MPKWYGLQGLIIVIISIPLHAEIPAAPAPALVALVDAQAIHSSRCFQDSTTPTRNKQNMQVTLLASLLPPAMRLKLQLARQPNAHLCEPNTSFTQQPIPTLQQLYNTLLSHALLLQCAAVHTTVLYTGTHCSTATQLYTCMPCNLLDAVQRSAWPNAPTMFLQASHSKLYYQPKHVPTCAECDASFDCLDCRCR